MVYAKRPFSSPEKVLDYLGRYTHRVAISNNRIRSAERVRLLSLTETAKMATPETITLQAEEFIRRFLLHVLPNGFMRIRLASSPTARRNRTSPAAANCWESPPHWPIPIPSLFWS